MTRARGRGLSKPNVDCTIKQVKQLIAYTNHLEKENARLHKAVAELSASGRRPKSSTSVALTSLVKQKPQHRVREEKKVESAPRPQTLDEQYTQALFTHVRANDYTPAELLLQKHAPCINIDTLDPETGETALIIAIKNDHTTMVKLLLASGADPRVCDRENCDPEFWAMYKRSHNLIAGALFRISQNIPSSNQDERQPSRFNFSH